MINYLKQSFGLYKKKKEFEREFKLLVSQEKNTNSRLSLKREDFFPCIWDKTSDTSYDHHYVLHTAWAARKLKEISPQKHVDISSSLYFSSIVSAFIKIDFYDFRPAQIELSNLESRGADVTNLHFESNSIASLSCMHTIEHIGLGRYGDSIEYDGDLRAISELKRVVSKNGSLLFVVPIGKPRIMFNAHRIYSYDQIMSYFSDFKCMEFSLIQDDNLGGNLIINASKQQADIQSYGCGCFWFIKE